MIRDGGETFIQYWLYYPDSTSTWMGSAGIWNTVVKRVTRKDYPGWHPDDWESVQVRIDDATGAARMRASSHAVRCSDVDTPGTAGAGSPTAATRATSRDPRDPEERTTTAAGVRLVPIEGLSAAERATEFEVSPPWEKRVYLDPRRILNRMKISRSID